MGVRRVNPVLQEASASLPSAQLLGVVAAVVSTTLAGLVFCFLRLRSRSLIAPILLHLATNDLGYLSPGGCCAGPRLQRRVIEAGWFSLGRGAAAGLVTIRRRGPHRPQAAAPPLSKVARVQ